MTTAMPRPGVDDPVGDLSLREAALLYAVAVRTLRTKVGCGEIVGYKVRGVRGREWRVTRDALELSGCGLRPTPDDARAPVSAQSPEARIAALERELSEARRTAAMQRARAEAADRELGFAMLECGRLRAVVARPERETVPVG